MSDPAQQDPHHDEPDAPGSPAPPAEHDSGYYENMNSMNSLAAAAHSQAHQPQPGMVDPMFFVNDAQHQHAQHQHQQYYSHPQGGYQGAPQPYATHAEQFQHALEQQLAGQNAPFQELFGQIHNSPYQHTPQQQQLLAMQQRAQQQAAAGVLHHPGNGVTASPSTIAAQAQALLPPNYAQQQQHLSRNAESSAGSTPQSAVELPTPAESAKPTVRTVPDRTLTKSRSDFRPKTAIPQDLTAEEYAAQCIQAAIASRLPPYALHRGEYEMLRDYINHTQVTTYINIRNGILRLWQRNPLVSVTREEAAGCAKDYRFFDVAEVAYNWLVLNGYINFGCIEVPNAVHTPRNSAKRRKTVVVIGAGMAGLGCARQLEGLFSQFGERVPEGEAPPNVVVLEARGRLGGRVYSHPLKNQEGSTLPEGRRVTADLGAQVITGFERGNPLGVLIRGQLALHYHSLKDNSVLHDADGKPVNKERDLLVEKLFNDILDRVSIFKHKPAIAKTVEGDRELIDTGKDPSGEGGKMIAEVEKNEVELPPMEIDSGNANGDKPAVTKVEDESFSAGVDKLTGKASTATGSSARIPAAEQVQRLGWELKQGSTGQETITLEPQGTLGKTMDHVLRQYQDLVNLTPEDLRMMNWHYANLEYANAANVGEMSLGYWDQDDGNEFGGSHAMLLGGYTQVPRGLWLAPTKLDVRTRHVVKKITYNPDEEVERMAKVECEDGRVIVADKIVVTLPLGVLKAGAVEFDPPLPEWKTGAIERIGYGLLNKVVLVYDQPFWDVDNDMVGLLREPMGDERIQESYEANRGRFYMFWNCIKSSGKPLLVALMAGDAATQTELEPDDSLVAEATAALRKMYPNATVPEPTETIITRWRKDPYSRGSYSYMGSEATTADYDAMARPVGNSLYFAGEACSKTHPASVHGAYISGLTAAADIATSLLGPLEVPTPLIPAKPKLDSLAASSLLGGTKRKAEDSAVERARELKYARLEAYENALEEALVAAIGERPTKPGRSGANPFLLYQKDHWFICKAKCDEARKKATGNPEAKATRNEVRAALGQMWRDAPEHEKRPYLDETEKNKTNNAANAGEFKKRMKEWDAAANRFRKDWKERNPSVPSMEEIDATKQAEAEKAEIKRSRKLNGYIDDSDDDDYC